MTNKGGKSERSDRLFSWAPKSLQTVNAPLKLKALAPWKESYDTCRQCIKKQRCHFDDKDLYSQSYGWTVKNAEHQRIDAFILWWWRSLLRVPCTAKRSNQSILKEINLKYSFEGLLLKLKLQNFDRLMQRANWLEKTLMLGKTEGKRRRGGRGWDG